MATFGKRISGLVQGATTVWGLLPANWQLVVTGIATVVTGYFGFQTGGIFWALIGASAVLAFGLMSLLLWIVLTKLTSVFERLTVETIGMSGGNLHKGKDGRNRNTWTLKHLTMELQLRNHSQRTLYFKIKRLTHSMSGKTLKDPPKLAEGISIVPPQTIQKILLATLPDLPVVNDMTGHIDLEIVYGSDKDDLRYLFVYESTPAMAISIGKNGQGQIQITAPIIKHLHGNAPILT